MGMTERQDVVCWLDPGLTTGLAWWDPETWKFFSGQYLPDDLLPTLADLASNVPGRLAVGTEKYLVTPRGRGIPKYSLEIIGQVQGMADQGLFTLLPSMPSSARMLGNVQMLRRLGWYKPGKGHANDAAMHTLAYLLRERKLPRELIKKALHSAP